MLKRLEDRLREIAPAEFRRMESEATAVTASLVGAFHDNFKGSLRSMDGLIAHPDYWNALWRRQLYRLSHDLKGLGGTFNYQLITIIGESLCALIADEDLPNDRFLQRYVTAHVAALQAILQFDMSGDGGGEGERLLATLELPEPLRPPR
ncbi:MAG: hypothetical protein HC861_01085 [Rhodospirillaceae bacterium]|nr:hypothetical protein [Rhodospirillaceae bacterium]